MSAAHNTCETRNFKSRANFFPARNALSRSRTRPSWWNRADLGAMEWFGFGVPAPGEREETLINLAAVRA
jgi:hypothetical protein